jgi:hypothetical protein
MKSHIATPSSPQSRLHCSPQFKNGELKELVVKVAPAFVAHRDAAKNLLTK